MQRSRPEFFCPSMPSIPEDEKAPEKWTENECKAKYDEAIKLRQEGKHLQAARIMLDLDEKSRYPQEARLWLNIKGVGGLKELAESKDPYQERAKEWEKNNILDVSPCLTQ